MREIHERVSQLVLDRALPESPDLVFNGFYSEVSKLFDIQESTLWDFKKEFPFDLSTSYSGGILRLVCALHNTYGGIIIFGVHDEHRTAGHNLTKINIERYNTFLREKLSAPIECVHRRYEAPHPIKQKASIDVLLVPKRTTQLPPVSFKVAVGGYPPGRVFLRKNHEVLEAKSEDIPFLYGPRHLEANLASDEARHPVIRALPPTPATIRHFVGRFACLNQLWKWLSLPDEPRAFLYGKGGSGKSTIAYEFAKLVADNIQSLAADSSRPIDAILFLTAKKRELKSIDGRISDYLGTEFATASELFERLLLKTGWLTSTTGLDNRELIKELEAMFRDLRILAVIDDIDSLTTAGVDPGMDEVYKVLIRTNTGSKLLYTQRNLPTQSIANAIEVPGLEIETEYAEFVESCCGHFKQPTPPIKLRDSDIARVSERRPLVIETLIGLRRSCSTYEEALTIFGKRGGDETRAYLFEREYLALGQDNRARLLLATLSLFEQPISFADLTAVLRFDEQQVHDAIGEVSEMFLTISQDEKSGETKYGLGQSTKDYIVGVRAKLDLFPKLRKTVSAYKGSVHENPPELVQLELRVGRYLNRNNPSKFDPAAAFSLLQQVNEPAISQHPRYQVLLGTSAAWSSPPKLEVAREAFKYVADMKKYSDPEAMRIWFYMERTSGHGMENAAKICDYVIDGNNYTKAVKSEFLAKKAFALQQIARSSFYADQQYALDQYVEAVQLNLRGLQMQVERTNMHPSQQLTWCGSCFSEYCRAANSAQQSRHVLDFVSNINEVDVDPIAQGLKEFVVHFSRAVPRDDKKEFARRRGLLERLREQLHGKRGLSFSSRDLHKDLSASVDEAITYVTERMR